MKRDMELWLTVLIACIIVGICVIATYWSGLSFKEMANWFCLGLGYAANMVIFYAGVKFFRKREIDIPGLGKFKVRSRDYDISSLTNIINTEFYDGKSANFDRAALLKTYYEGAYTVVNKSFSPEPTDTIHLEIKGQQLEIRKAHAKTPEELLKLVSMLFFDEKEVAPDVKKQIFKAFYDVKIKPVKN